MKQDMAITDDLINVQTLNRIWSCLLVGCASDRDRDDAESPSMKHNCLLIIGVKSLNQAPSFITGINSILHVEDSLLQHAPAIPDFQEIIEPHGMLTIK